MAKFKYDTDDTSKWKPTSCAVCDNCYIFIKTGRCRFGGPFKGYALVDYEGRPIKEVSRGEAESPSDGGET